MDAEYATVCQSFEADGGGQDGSKNQEIQGKRCHNVESMWNHVLAVGSGILFSTFNAA